ncbi:hypothetical protein V7O61_14460 [Methanolobus sp. WCC1]|jgi:uncharacterized membrane protein YoaK (UPF0700 family)|uniref:hypothetical protein n=1 Tax=unclassified Methanolobus TaxID=2629569 RepID=UPI0032567D58
MAIGTIILVLVGIYLLVIYNSRFKDKNLINRAIALLFFLGLIISASVILGFFVESIARFVTYPHVAFFVIPSMIATLFYRKFSAMKDIEIASLFVWGIISLLAGSFIGFFMTMDNPPLNGSDITDFSQNSWMFHVTLKNIGMYLLNTLVISIPYAMHSRTDNRIYSVIWSLIIVFLALIYAYVTTYLLYGL